LWLHALYIYALGAWSLHIHTHTECEDYGTYENNEYEEGRESHAITSCSACGFQLQDQIQSDEMIGKKLNEFDLVKMM